MALPLKLLPDTIRPASFEIQRSQNVLTSSPMIGPHRMQTRIIGEASHSIKLKYDPIPSYSMGDLIPFLNSLRGPHDKFGLILQNYAKGTTGLVPGNYLTTTGGKTRQLLATGEAPNTELFTWATAAAGKVFTNSVQVWTSIPVGVYFDASVVPTGSTVELWTTNTGVTGSTMSDAFYVTPGRNVVVLTPTSTGTAYIRISQAVTATAYSVKTCVLASSYDIEMAPALLAGNASDYIIPLPAAVMTVSLKGSAQKITYGSDSLIRIELDLVERYAT